MMVSSAALTLNAQMAGDTPVTVPLANSAALSWSQPASPVASGWLQTNDGLHALANLQRRLDNGDRSHHRADGGQEPGAGAHL